MFYFFKCLKIIQDPRKSNCTTGITGMVIGFFSVWVQGTTQDVFLHFLGLKKKRKKKLLKIYSNLPKSSETGYLDFRLLCLGQYLIFTIPGVRIPGRRKLIDFLPLTCLKRFICLKTR
uniref:Uncharacterized protein n=1 Tax=Cacopsylla melanoneura TaxID=428564 RepID=A0A8D8WYL3_9HEMI